MTDNKDLIGQYCRQFNMSGIPASLDQLLMDAESGAMGYLDYTSKLLGIEAAYREQNDIRKCKFLNKVPRLF